MVRVFAGFGRPLASYVDVSAIRCVSARARLGVALSHIDSHGAGSVSQMDGTYEGPSVGNLFSGFN